MKRDPWKQAISFRFPSRCRNYTSGPEHGVRSEEDGSARDGELDVTRFRNKGQGAKKAGAGGSCRIAIVTFAGGLVGTAR